MHAGIAWLIALLVIWFELRHPNAARASRQFDGKQGARQPGLTPEASCSIAAESVHRPTPETSRRASPGALVDALAIAAIVCAYLPLLPLLRTYSALPEFLPADARTHALVAMHLFDGALASGWSDQYVGGFPLALHYPIVGWLLTGIPMKLGLRPALAVTAVCTLALVSTSLIAYLLARFNRLGITASLVGALALAWISPLNAFVGGYESFFVTGLVSQVVAMPLMVGWFGTTLGRGSLATAAGLAALCFLTHPQVAVPAVVFLGLIVAATARRAVAVRFLFSLLFAGIVAALVYGPGIIHLQLPFGWPISHKWLKLGFGPDRLDDWLIDGDLLDQRRDPILTALWLASFTLALFKWRHPAARAVVAASCGALGLAIIGPSVEAAGRVGQQLLTVLQPLRALALVPIAVAGTLVVAIELHRHVLALLPTALLFPFRRAWRDRNGMDNESSRAALGNSWHAFALGSLLVVVSLNWAVDACLARVSAVRRWSAALGEYSERAPCGQSGPSQLQWERLRLALSKLQSGRLWFDSSDDALTLRCAMAAGLERQSAVPVGPTRGVAAHVGFLSAVNSLLQPNRPGLARRAESLGLRYLLLDAPIEPSEDGALRLLGTFGPLHLYEQRGNTDLFASGCVHTKWAGENAILDQALKLQLNGPAFDSLLHPTDFSELSIGHFPLHQSVETDACRHEAATLSNPLHSVGEHRITVDTSAPVDLVLRVTASPTWRWRIDNQLAMPRLVFPGYYALRVPPGRHLVDVVHRWNACTIAGFILAGVGPLLTSALQRAQRRRRWFARR
jgi:hypothetical protein